MLAMYIYNIINNDKLEQILQVGNTGFNPANSVQGNRAIIGDKMYMIIFIDITGLELSDCDEEMAVLISRKVGDGVLEFAYKQIVPLT